MIEYHVPFITTNTADVFTGCRSLQVLEEAGIWRRVKRIAGTSAGAMTAALLAVGYDSYHLEKVFSSDIQNVMTGKSKRNKDVRSYVK